MIFAGCFFFCFLVFWSIGMVDMLSKATKRRHDEDNEKTIRYITGLELSTGIIDEAEAVEILRPYNGVSFTQTDAGRIMGFPVEQKLGTIMTIDDSPFAPHDLDVIAR